jgi:FAD/FMN-containing dehydrogenase
MLIWSTPGDPSYDGDRRGLTASAVVPDLHPAAVARVSSAEDVRSALARAATEGLVVTCRSGGHSAAFSMLRAGMLALDLSGLDAIEVDLAAGTAVVGPGAGSLTVARALQGSGWSFPVGHRAGVALGGFLLAGGNGWNQGEWGSAVESVVAADVLLADGRAVRLSRITDPEAFDLLRGVGPGFPGIVTGFDLRLWPEPVVRRRIVSFPSTRVASVGAWADHLASAIDPAVELTVFLAPPGSPMHPDLDQVALTVAVTAFAADGTAGEALLAVVDDTTPAGGRVAYAGGSDLPTMLEMETAPPGLGLAFQQAWSTSTYADLLPPLVPAMAAAPSIWSSILVSSSSYRRAAAPATDPAYLPLGTLTVAPYANWLPGERDDEARDWPTATVDVLREHWTGHYVGEVDLLRTPDRLAACFRPGVLDRLAVLRARLDPDGRFATHPGDSR